MIIITSYFFIVSNKVNRIGYNGETYKPLDKIEIKSEDMKNFDLSWLIPIKEEKPEETIKPELTKEIKNVIKTEITESEPKEEKKSVRGRRKVI